MSDRFPGYQNMISCNTPAEILTQHEHHCQFNKAVDGVDCWLTGLEAIPEWDIAYKQHFRSRYQIHFATYKGWRVYMNHTGCYAMIPEEEAKVTK